MLRIKKKNEDKILQRYIVGKNGNISEESKGSLRYQLIANYFAENGILKEKTLEENLVGTEIYKIVKPVLNTERALRIFQVALKNN